MYTKHLFTSVASIAILTIAQTANAYDWKVDLTFADTDQASDPAYGATINYFFSPVNYGTTTPWAETAFTNRIAYAGVGAVYRKLDTAYNLSATTKAFALGYNHRKASSPHAFSFALGQMKVETTIPELSYTGYPYYTPVYRIQTTTQKVFSYGIGYSHYLQDNWEVSASLELEEASFLDVYTLKLSTNRLWDLGNQKWFGFRASIANKTAKTIYNEASDLFFELEGRYYFTEKTGVSLGLNFPDSGKPRTLEIGLQHHLTKAASIALGYNYTELDFSVYSIQPNGGLPSDSSSTIQAQFGLRF